MSRYRKIGIYRSFLIVRNTKINGVIRCKNRRGQRSEMAARSFSKYNFRLGRLLYSNKSTINFEVSFFSKGTPLILVIKECVLEDGKREALTYYPEEDKVIELNANEMKRYSFSFSNQEISTIRSGTQLRIKIFDTSDQIIVTICYKYGESSRWALESVYDKDYIGEEEMPEELTDLDESETNPREIDISDIDLSVRTHNCLRRAGILSLGDIMDKTIDEISSIKGLHPNGLMEVLTKLRQYGVWCSKESVINSKKDEKNAINSHILPDRDTRKNDIKQEMVSMPGIQPGYKIIHKRFGEGIVISSDQFLEVQFPNAPNVKLQSAWVKTNCKIITPQEEQVEFQKEMMRLKSVMEQVIEKKILNIVDEFKKFSLSEHDLKEVEQFFRFKLRYAEGHKKALRYNLLVQCDNDSEAVRFLKEIEAGLKKLGVLSKKSLIKTESEMEDKPPSKYPLECSLLGIHDCSPIMKDSVGIVSSVIRGSLQLEKQKKDLNWNLITKLASYVPDCTIVAVGPKGFIDYIKEKDEWYYRFFAHRIFIKSMTVEEIVKAVYCGIRSEELVVTNNFKEAIEQYINVVYPKADLKDAAFVDDLLNRIFVNYYLAPTDGQLSANHVPFYRKPKSFEEISEQLNQLIGLHGVKKQFKDIYKLSQDPLAINKQRLHFAFVGNPGTGKTTVARLTADLLYSMGLIKRNKVVVVAPTDIISVYKDESAQLMREKIEEAIGGVLFIDEAYFLTSNTSDNTSHQKQCLEVLIQDMENRSDELTVIFAGYQNEIEEMMKSNPGISSRVPYKFIFEDYTNEELLQIFINLAAQEGMSLEKEAHGIMLDRIAFAKTEENFGNARTIANIYQQLKVIWLEQERKERIITAADIKQSMPVALNADMDKMIGLVSIKQELKNFEARVKYIKFLQEKKVTIPAPNMHMMFMGNPGTGKTTVARKIADCLYQIGILKTNKLIVAERKDLVGRYVGETAPKTSELIQKAMNGVLFIDEAYSLYRPEDSKDPGMEAIATLITAMENNKDRLVVIFAGYRKEMKVFQSANPGITSRIGFTFHFPDYSPVELTEMFYMKMKKYGFSANASSLEQVKKLMEYFSELEDFGNGRFVDKVIDMTINNRAQRSYSKEYNDITEKDIPEIKDLIKISSNKQSLRTDEEQTESMRRRIAIHEAGHAIVSYIVFPDKRIMKISINADAASMGKAVIESDSNNLTESSLKGMLVVLFGGRNAERLLLGDHSVGCSSDIAEAKKIAGCMINDLAMGELGVTTVMDLLQEADQMASDILKQYKSALSYIADRLCEQGTIMGPDLPEELSSYK